MNYLGSKKLLKEEINQGKKQLRLIVKTFFSVKRGKTNIFCFIKKGPTLNLSDIWEYLLNDVES